MSVNPRREKGGTQDADVLLARALVAVWDDITLDEVRERIAAADLPEPTLLVDSGYGIHGYWRLEEPIRNLDEWTTLQKRLIATVGSDTNVHDPARTMRLPGTWNRMGQPAILCRIISAQPQLWYALAVLEGLLQPPGWNAVYYTGR